MYSSILICSDGSPTAGVAADYAIWFAQKLGAQLRALHVTDVRLLEGPLLSDLAGALGAQPYSALVPQLQQIQQQKAEAILQAVGTRCEKAGIACELIHQTGGLIHAMHDQETATDLVVFGQRGEHAQWSWEPLGSSVERMVRASSKPCLVCSDEFQPVNRLLMAYDGSDESTKALRSAIELSDRLQAPLAVVTVYEHADQQKDAERVSEQARLLADNRKLDVTVRVVGGSAEEQIIQAAEETAANLIVMGAYGHTRIRELILGSTTSHVMRHATVPVLLSRH